MGQKVHPVGFRLGVSAQSQSRWFAGKEFRDYLKEDHQIRTHILTKLDRAGVSRIEIERGPSQIVITVHASKPGMIIGRGGTGIEELRKALTKISSAKSLRVNVEEIRTPDLDAYLVGRNIASQLERRISFRRALRLGADRTMKAGALGVKISVAGRLGGAEMSRRETATLGSIPLHTLRADINFARTEARTTFGVIGVKVWIYKGQIFGQKPAQTMRPPQTEGRGR
jgi:small subunit ribosomal protein S3